MFAMLLEFERNNFVIKSLKTMNDGRINEDDMRLSMLH